MGVSAAALGEMFSGITAAGVGAGAAAVGAGAAIYGATRKQNNTVLSPPPVAPPPVMATPDDQQVQDARRRSLALQMGRQGRASTILSQSDQSDTLG